MSVEFCKAQTLEVKFYGWAQIRVHRFVMRRLERIKMLPRELAKHAEPLRTDNDHRIIDAVAIGLVEVGKDDDIQRLRGLIEGGESEDHIGTACEIAIAWIRFAQDLKEELRAKRFAGYL